MRSFLPLKVLGFTCESSFTVHFSYVLPCRDWIKRVSMSKDLTLSVVCESTAFADRNTTWHDEDP